MAIKINFDTPVRIRVTTPLTYWNDNRIITRQEAMVNGFTTIEMKVAIDTDIQQSSSQSHQGYPYFPEEIEESMAALGHKGN